MIRISAFIVTLGLIATSSITGESATATTAPSVNGTAGNALATVTVHARQIGPGTAATGTFTAKGNLLPLSGLGTFRFSGPVTCLDIRGNRAGLIYPITAASGPVASNAKGQAVYVTIQDNGPGRPTQIGFVGPAPVKDLTVCPPLATFMKSTFGRVAISR